MQPNVLNPYVVNKSVAIAAPKEAVWEALTNPTLTKKYFFHCGVFSNWKPGDKISFKGRIFLVKKIEMNGKILQINPGSLLKYTLTNRSSDGGDSVSTVTDRLKFEHGKTILTVTDDVGEGPGAEKRYERSLKGWDKILQGLKKVVESRNPS
ncbi:MAG TPA: SRPBCC domain-containing protein [Chryseolinea sp.]|nr:SRPBCC domain-containing protein [Chryseolinea sp.]